MLPYGADADDDGRRLVIQPVLEGGTDQLLNPEALQLTVLGHGSNLWETPLDV